MNLEENLRTTPSKGAKPGSSTSPSTRGSAKKGTKNAKITNFFTKVNSPLARNSSNSNAEIADDSNGDASSSSMKAPPSSNLDEAGRKALNASNKDYVFIVPSSDDDTKGSTTKGSQTSKRKRPPSIHSNTSKSSDGFVLSTNMNNELGISRKKRVLDLMGSDHSNKHDSSSNQEASSTPTPTRSLSRDSTPTNQSGPKTINRIRPTMIGSRTKMIDFQSVPSDLNLPRDQAQKLIERLFLVKMPEDFYLFWDFAKTINHRKPCSAFSHAHLELNLVGPFDVLSGLITDFHGFSREHLLRHCRFYYDPPEFQTVIVKKDDKHTHYGYFRDEPGQEKPIVVMNRGAIGGQIHEVGDNLFTLLRSELETAIAALSKSSQEVPTLTSSSSRTPRASSAKEQSEKQDQLEKAKAKQELTIIRDKLLDFCSNHENLSSESWSRTNTRRTKRCAKTLNSVGIVVPRNGEGGYRDLGVTDAKLKNMLAKIGDYKDEKDKCGLYKELHNIIHTTNMANDECNFGVGLELGMDLFYQGDPVFHSDIEFLLKNAYTLLERPEFYEILKTHLEDRKQGDKVSLLD